MVTVATALMPVPVESVVRAAMPVSHWAVEALASTAPVVTVVTVASEAMAAMAVPVLVAMQGPSPEARVAMAAMERTAAEGI